MNTLMLLFSLYLPPTPADVNDVWYETLSGRLMICVHSTKQKYFKEFISCEQWVSPEEYAASLNKKIVFVSVWEGYLHLQMRDL